MIHVIHDRSYTVVTFTLTRISRKSSLVRENSFHRTIDFSKIESLYILKKKIDKRPAENVCWWLARRVDSSMVEYGKDNINSFLIEEQPLEEPEPACFNISPYELLGKGETRAKIIVRLKLEEIVSFSKLSSCRYVNRMSSDQTRLDWLGYLIC